MTAAPTAPTPPAAAPSPVGREIAYRGDRLLRGGRPGRHRSASGDGGFEFRSHALLQQTGDARRLDLLASLREPFGQWLVRQSSLRRALPVVVLADLSASMAHGADGSASWETAADGSASWGPVAKLPPADRAPPPRHALLADLLAALAWSATRGGDAIGFIGAAERPLPAWWLPPGRQAAPALALAQRLRTRPPDGRGSQGLLPALAWLPRRRSQVWLVSDYLWPDGLLPALLRGLAAHQVVPLVLSRPDEADLGGRSGLATLRDAESGRQRLVWWRPALRAAWQQARAAQRQALAAQLARHRLRPLWLDGGLDVDRINRWFQA